MKTAPIQTKRARLWRSVATMALLGIGVWLLIANRAVLGRGAKAMQSAHIGWTLLGVVLTMLTFGIAAMIYRLLALKSVRYRQLLLVELAASFANRLLPAGLGGVSLHGLYLYRRKHTPAQATAVVSVNNLLGIVAHLLLLAFVIGFQPDLLKQFTGRFHDFHWWYGVIVVAAGVMLGFWPRLRHKGSNFIGNLIISVRALRPYQLGNAFLCALLLTTTYTLVLYSAAHAIGLTANLLQIFIIFSLGMLVGTATPTPGGLVGTEAGLFAGFTTYGASVTLATAVVILYRLLTYWLPLLPGILALLLARQRRFV